MNQLPRILVPVGDFLPLLMFGALAIVVLRQRGNALALPALAGAQLGMWLAPSSETALVVGLAGAGLACLPMTIRGPLAAAAHVGGLVLVVPVSLAIVGVADSATADLPAGLSWLIDLLLFGVLPATLLVLPLVNVPRTGRGVLIAAGGFFAVLLLLLAFVSATAAADRIIATSLMPAGQVSPPLTLATQSGVARLYAGYAATPRAQTFTFLQSGGTSFDVAWSTVRGAEAVVDTAATQPEWTNPVETCPGGAVECGRFAVAVPVAAPPGRPEAWILNGGAEEVIDDTTWHGQHGELTLSGHQYGIILTDAANISAWATVTLRWPLPWDGTGALAVAITASRFHRTILLH